MPDARQFPYDLAFDRNLGWITDWEQLALRSKRVAIAGMGGVGGLHLLTLARLGVGVTDLWAEDNGFLFDWSIQFDSSLIADCSNPIIQ